RHEYRFFRRRERDPAAGELRASVPDSACRAAAVARVSHRACTRQRRRQAEESREVRDSRVSIDAIVVGAGHNGLVCACYLAKAGLKVQVLERRGVVGGAAVTEEFHPGFRNSTAAYTVSLLQAKVIRDLDLASHGLRIVERPLSNFLPLESGYLKVGGGLEATQREFGKFSARDARNLPHYWEKLERVADVLRAAVLETPPNAG